MGDVGRLLVVSNQHGATLVVDAVFGVVVPDAADGVPRNLDVVDVGGSGNFTGQNDQARVAQRFGCDTRVGVLREDGVQDRIGNLVGNLVGVPFGDGFGSEEKIVIGHRCVLSVRLCRRIGSRGALHPGLHDIRYLGATL
ncbi:hypothetical protein D3C81_1787320 [compost metagenome]